MPDSLFEPPDWLEREQEVLASYAMHTRHSRGRKYPEPPHAFRTLYQRDRDRIVHSTAFRRLMHKTQVLVNPGGDYHRTRLTHTLEVAQIARTIWGILRSGMPARRRWTNAWGKTAASSTIATACGSPSCSNTAIRISRGSTCRSRC